MTLKLDTRKDPRRTLVPALALVLLAAALPSLAGPALHTTYGDPLVFQSAEIAGMAGTGAALYRGGFSAVLNPACLTAETRTRIDGTIVVDQQHEDRYVPLFDTFDSLVRETAVASNRNHYFGAGFGYVRSVGDENRPMAFAVAVSDRADYRYDFEEEIRDPNAGSSPRDTILRERRITADGVLRNLSGAFGAKIGPDLSVGAAIHYAFGNNDFQMTERYLQEPASSSFSEDAWDLNGVNFTLGLLYDVDERVTIGLAYETPLGVDGDLTGTFFDADTDTFVTTGQSLDYPRRLRGGMTYRPRATPRTLFCLDAVFTEWSEMDDSRLADDPVLHDTLDVRIGVEHLFYNGTALRFGFRHVDSYAANDISTSIFTLGVGGGLGDGRASVSVELAKNSSVQPHWFDYNFPDGYDPYVYGETSQVDYTEFRVGAGYTLAF